MINPHVEDPKEDMVDPQKEPREDKEGSSVHSLLINQHQLESIIKD